MFTQEIDCTKDNYMVWLLTRNILILKDATVIISAKSIGVSKFEMTKLQNL